MPSPFPSKTELVILRLMLAGRGFYGLELVHSSAGALKRGTIYVLLDRLEGKGFIKSRISAENSGRRLYEITGVGRRVALAIEDCTAGSSLGAFA